MMRKGIKLLLFLGALLLPLHNVNAGSTLIIEMTDGKTTSFNLQEKPVVTMSGSKMVIKSLSLSANLERNDVVRFYFKDTDATVGIEPVTEKDVLKITQDSSGRFLITDFDTDDNIIVSDMKGRLYRECVSIDGRTAIIDLSSCHQGIYIIRIGKKQSIKITRK